MMGTFWMKFSRNPLGSFKELPSGYFGGYFWKIPTPYPLGKSWVNCFRTLHVLSMDPLGNWPLAPSASSSVEYEPPAKASSCPSLPLCFVLVLTAVIYLSHLLAISLALLITPIIYSLFSGRCSPKWDVCTLVVQNNGDAHVCVGRSFYRRLALPGDWA